MTKRYREARPEGESDRLADLLFLVIFVGLVAFGTGFGYELIARF